jgi:hypothetical protein
MGFWNGRVTFTRYQVSGDRPLPLGEEILEQTRQHQIGLAGTLDPADGVATGWSGGDHVLDLTIELGKNIVDDALHLAIRIDSDKIPAALLRAYTQLETEARAQQNPSGIATKAQRQEAKEAAQLRAAAEAADGRFRRLNAFPVLWDANANFLYAGSTSANVLDRLQILFRETFDRTLEPITSGSLARGLAPDDSAGPRLSLANFDRGPLAASRGTSAPDSIPAWAGDDHTSLDFLGNEFLVWIWHALQNDGESVSLTDGSTVTVMLAKTLTLDCPRGETGRDHLTDDAPTRLPEALRALQSGKLPRKAGMILVRQGAEYELTLQAESLQVAGLSLPKAEGVRLSPFETKLTRLESLRHLSQTLDLLFDAFLRRRTSSAWTDDLGRIRRWLQAA